MSFSTVFRILQTNTMTMKQKEYTEKDFGKDYRKLMKMITDKLNACQEGWEVDEVLEMLWQLGDHGDLNAFCMYGLALLMEGKGWYDLEEGRITIETCAEEGNAMSQYYLGLLNYDGREGWEQDVITGKYWMEKAAEQGYQEAIEFLKDRYAC